MKTTETIDKTQHSTNFGAVESPVNMNIGTVQFNTIRYSDPRIKSSRSNPMLRKYPTNNSVNVISSSDSSDYEDGFIETSHKAGSNSDDTLNVEEEEQKAARFGLGSVQPIYKHHHFTRQIEKGYTE